MRNAVLLPILITLLFAPVSTAQDDEKPTVAFLKWGDSSNVALAEKAILDMLEAYGFINEDERALLNDERSFEGENLSFIYGDALFDRMEANAVIEKAIDRGADVLVTFTTQMTQITYYAIREFIDPPKLIFTVTSGPYITGVADSSCIKPDFVIGTVPVTNYEDIVPLLLMQDPGMQVVGAIYSPAQRASEVGVARITAIAESLGLTVEAETIMATPDLYQAVENLANRGAEAIIIPIFTFQGFQLLLSLSYDYGLPVLFSAPQNAYRGGTIGGGFFGLYKQGAIAGNMLVAYLNGDLDIAQTSIYESDDLPSQSILTPPICKMSRYRKHCWTGRPTSLKAGRRRRVSLPPTPRSKSPCPTCPWRSGRAADLDFLAGLECTPEMIAEQQAELES